MPAKKTENDIPRNLSEEEIKNKLDALRGTKQKIKQTLIKRPPSKKEKGKRGCLWILVVAAMLIITTFWMISFKYQSGKADNNNQIEETIGSLGKDLGKTLEEVGQGLSEWQEAKKQIKDAAGNNKETNSSQAEQTDIANALQKLKEELANKPLNTEILPLPDTSTWQTYINKDYSFAIKFPLHYNRHLNEAAEQDYLERSSIINAENPNNQLEITVFPESWLAENEGILMKAERIELNGFPTWKQVLNIGQATYFLQHNNLVYSLQASGGEVLPIIATFQFIGS